MNDTQKIGELFTELVGMNLTDEEIEGVVKNETPGARLSALNDIYDANVDAVEAFEGIMGRKPNFDDEADCLLIEGALLTAAGCWRAE